MIYLRKRIDNQSAFFWTMIERVNTESITIWQRIHTGQITRSNTNSWYAIHKQNTRPKVAIESISFGFFRIDAIKITTYPTRPNKGVEIPKVLETGPVITASQLIDAFILHGLKAGCAICCQSRYTASNTPNIASHFTYLKIDSFFITKKLYTHNHGLSNFTIYVLVLWWS